MVALSRSARLAAWGNSWLAGATSLDEADERIRADDVAHHVSGLSDDGGATTLLLALGTLRTRGTKRFSLALPAPGDPLGLAGPKEFVEAAVEAGEAVLCQPVGIGLIPHVVGEGVQWTVHPAGEPAPLAMSEVSLELTEVLQQCIDVLADLDPAHLDELRWRGDVAEALAGLRAERRKGDGLPPGYPPRAEQLAARAWTCLSICELVLGDTGSVGTAADAEVRNEALRRLERSARRGLVAAYAAPLSSEPAS